MMFHYYFDYNRMFGTSYDTSSERFQNYYRDVSLRMKNRDIDKVVKALDDIYYQIKK